MIPILSAEGRAFFKRELFFGPPGEVEIVAGYFEARRKRNLGVAWPPL